MARGQERHELVNQVLLGKPTGFNRHAQDVMIDRQALVQAILLLPDEITSDVADHLDSRFNLTVALDRQVRGDDARKKERRELEESGLSIGLEDGVVVLVQRRGGVGDGVEVLAHACYADDVQCCSARPLANLHDRFVAL